MGQLLFLDCCVRGGESRTLRLCNHFIEEMEKKDPTLQVRVRKLYEEEIPAMDQKMLEHRDRLIADHELGDMLFDDAREFAAVDYILIGAPYWDYSFPACLKNYIERISVNGLLFTYVENGSVGLCKAEKLMYISTAGGFLPESGHLGELYMKQLCDFYGIEQMDSFCAQGLDIWGADVKTMMGEAEKEVRSAAGRWQ